VESSDEVEVSRLEVLGVVFCDQLLACLEECMRGRRGLFSEYQPMSDDAEDRAWPEAARLRELAIALQGLFAQQEMRNALCEEFLDLCSIHGESHPGERKLARAFLERIEKGEVGMPTQEQRKPW
jgi:hypothetical protein